MSKTVLQHSCHPGRLKTLVLLQESTATLISSYLCDFFTENYDLGLGVKVFSACF
ncbi:hypothetical protein VTO73DRAFT_6210 [Trametes versicolor]